MKNRIFRFIASAVMSTVVLSTFGNVAVSAKTKTDHAQTIESNKAKHTSKKTGDKLSIVCTNFPAYDFARQIVGKDADVTMLLKPGAESHTYEPTPEDIVKIKNSDMFVYVGGDSDEWVSDVLDSMDDSHTSVFKMMDQVKTVEEETIEGMEAEEDEEESEEPELDEHVWTSPANAMTIVKKMDTKIEKLDPKHKKQYRKHAASYIKKIKKLDDKFKKVVKNGRRKEIIVADRFPFRYFCEEYGLKYYAAFPGCSTDTEPSAKTVAFLTDKVKKDHIPVVFHIELSNEEMAQSIAEATHTKSELLNAVHNVSDSDFKEGATYVSLMEHNVKVLKEALN